MPQHDPYDVLGVAPDANASELHAAWRRLCTIYHPDRYTSAAPDVQAEAARRMAEVNQAYSTVRSHPRSPSAAEPTPPAPPVPPAADYPAHAGPPTSASATPPPRQRRRGVVVAIALLVGCVSGLLAYAVLDEDRIHVTRVVQPEQADRRARQRLSPLEAPADGCPPQGEVRWITDALRTEPSGTTAVEPAPAFQVRASGRIENDTVAAVNVMPFVSLSDGAEQEGIVVAIVDFVDGAGFGGATPSLEPGESVSWVLRAEVRTQRADGTAGGRPVRADPVADGLTAWSGTSCTFTATVDESA